MILLTVKITDALRKSPATPGEFDRAWFRLVNSDTSQTLDYKHFKDVLTPDNPTSQEEGGAGDEGEDGGAGKQSIAPQYTYVAGRIFFDHKGNGRWVYESFNHVFASDKFEKEGGDLCKLLGEIYSRSEREVEEQALEIKEARQKVIANEEERRIAAAASAAKKKGAKGKKEAVVEEEKREDKAQGPPPKRQLDLMNLEDFKEALKEKVPRPFVFGPVEFTNLDLPEEEVFPAVEWRSAVVDNLMKTLQLPENLCIHGFNVTIKNKTLKRATTILKHSRFLRNMKVSPVFPAPPQQVEAAPAEAAAEEAE